jgi:hypothetical protein
LLFIRAALIAAHYSFVFSLTRQICPCIATDKDYKFWIHIVAVVLICWGLRDLVVDGKLDPLAYGMDQGPPVDDRSWTKSKIKVETLRALEIDKDIYMY